MLLQLRLQIHLLFKGERIFIKQEIFPPFSFLLKMYFWLIVMTVTNNNCILVETTVISVSVLWPASGQSSFGDSWEVTTHTTPDNDQRTEAVSGSDV